MKIVVTGAAGFSYGITCRGKLACAEAGEGDL